MLHIWYWWFDVYYELLIFLCWRVGTPLLYQTPIKVLIGEPIDTPAVLEADKGKQVDPEVVDKYHKKYIDAVKRLYKEYYAAEKGGASRSLVIV